MDAWLPPPDGDPIAAPRTGVGRPLRDNATLADLRCRFRTLVETEGFDRHLNRKIGTAMRQAFLDAWREHLGIDADTELVVHPTTQHRYSAAQLAWYGQVEELHRLLVHATCVTKTDVGRTAMAQLHQRGYTGKTQRRAGVDTQVPREHHVPPLSADSYQWGKAWIIRQLECDGYQLDHTSARSPQGPQRSRQALVDECAARVQGTDAAPVKERCWQHLEHFERVLGRQLR